MTPELDAQHRAQLAEALWTADRWCRDPEAWNDLHETVRDEYRQQADALAPLVAEWLADAWDRGSNDYREGWREGRCKHVIPDNPYRGGDS